MRNALILLAVVALLILVVGALNNGTAFDVDYAAGTVSAVSLFWVSAVIAALVFVVGLAAAWFAQAAVSGSRRKLEAELQSTYERLREAEAIAARQAPAVVEASPAAAEVAPAVATVVVIEDETHVIGEEATIVADEVAGKDDDVVTAAEVTVIAAEAGTIVVAEDETVASGGSTDDEVAAADEAALAATTVEPGETTAITMTGEAAGDDAAGEGLAAESPAGDPPAGEGEAARPGS